ncbi:MAG: efflux RND transporter permease subunit, partial [Planctomycetota bacterium]
MRPGRAIGRFAVSRPKVVIGVMVAATVLLGALIPRVKVDTDPENMLAEDEPVRVLHNDMKREFGLHDMVVLGVVNEEHEHGVFNPDSLARIHELTEFARTLQWPDPDGPDKTIGVIEMDLLALSMVDNIEPGEPGSVRFEWLMAKPPTTQEAALEVRRKAQNNPLFNGTLVSEDGKAVCIYLPLTSKDLSSRVYAALTEKIATLEGPEEYHITGLPVAEDVFGVQMFKQMAISAPLAMLVIFILMWVFFRSTVVVVSAMIDALIAVVCTMGLMIGLGYTVHIMSSMIPIFVMPMAVLDDVHVLSEFFDRYGKGKSRAETLKAVLGELFIPMLYTTLTSAAGFASLALTPIPPVQVFGVFVAFGIMVAWVCSVMVVPAYIMLLPQRVLDNFGAAAQARRGKKGGGGVTPLLRWLGGFAYRRAKLILALTAVVAAIAGYGISLIRINDNPVKWFEKGHPIRVADRILNDHFGGTYMAYLVLEPERETRTAEQVAQSLDARLEDRKAKLKEYFSEALPTLDDAATLVKAKAKDAADGEALLDTLEAAANERQEQAEGDAIDAWAEVTAVIGKEKLARQTFKRPDVLRYVHDLQHSLAKTDVVGKSSSLTDLVRKVYKELMGGAEEHYRVPDTQAAVAECLLETQNGHLPTRDDLWHFVEKPNEAKGKVGYRKTSLWVQLTSGDNRDMERVVAAADAFMAEHEAPVKLRHRWFGLTYINVVWQDKMVS